MDTFYQPLARVGLSANYGINHTPLRFFLSLTLTQHQYFSWLMNEENPRVETEEREPNQGLTAPINEAETDRALKGMKSGKAVGSDEIPAEVWKCLGWFGVVTLCKLFNSIMITETIPSAWRDSVLVPIFKEKGDIQECKNYRGIKLLTHTFKIWEPVLDRRVRESARTSMKASSGSCQGGVPLMLPSFSNRR